MREAWLQRLPEAIEEMERRWSLTLGSPFGEASCAWVAAVTLADESAAVLKVAMPHMEARDEKPFVGDPAYDATQHLLNCLDRLSADPVGTINRFADLLEIDRDRVRLWLVARSPQSRAKTGETVD